MISETWTYASSNSVTYAGDLTGIYPVGGRVRLVQGSIKYFVIVSITYLNGVSTIVLDGGGVYTLTNSAITSHDVTTAFTKTGFPYTLLKASNSLSGLMPALDNDITKFLRGDGAWAIPAGSGGGSRGGYDAIVYVEDTQIIAKDAYGVLILSGVFGTDDADVINAALDNLSDGGLLYIAPAYYQLTASLIIKYSNLEIAGSLGTYLALVGNFDLFKTDTGAIKHNIFFHDLNIWNSTATTDGCGMNIHIGSYFRMERVVLYGFIEDGVKLHSASSIYSIVIAGCEITESGGVAIDIVTPTIDTFYIIGNVLSDNTALNYGAATVTNAEFVHNQNLEDHAIGPDGNPIKRTKVASDSSVGTGSEQTITHGLGAIPDVILVYAGTHQATYGTVTSSTFKITMALGISYKWVAEAFT